MTKVHSCTRSIHQVPTSHGKPQQWGRMFQMQKHFLRRATNVFPPPAINCQTYSSFKDQDTLELDDAVHTAILTLKEGFEGQISGKNIEIGIIGADKQFRVLTLAEIDDYLAEVE